MDELLYCGVCCFDCSGGGALVGSVLHDGALLAWSCHFDCERVRGDADCSES